MVIGQRNFYWHKIAHNQTTSYEILYESVCYCKSNAHKAVSCGVNGELTRSSIVFWEDGVFSTQYFAKPDYFSIVIVYLQHRVTLACR